MSGKKTILAVSLFCLVAALLVIGFWINPKSKAEEGPRDYIWGYVTYEASATRDDRDEAVLWDEQKQNRLHTVRIQVFGADTLYKGLHPPSGEEGWYWVQGEGPSAGSGFYHVYFIEEVDIRQDIYMHPGEHNK